VEQAHSEKRLYVIKEMDFSFKFRNMRAGKVAQVVERCLASISPEYPCTAPQERIKKY
jgi:hypothetical protein